MLRSVQGSKKTANSAKIAFAFVTVGICTLGIVTTIGTIGLGLMVGSAGLAAAARTVVIQYEGISQDLRALNQKFMQIHEIVSECSANIMPVRLEVESVEQERLFVSDHIKTSDDYYSFCKVLDIMLDRVKMARLKTERAKRKLQNVIDEVHA